METFTNVAVAVLNGVFDGMVLVLGMICILAVLQVRARYEKEKGELTFSLSE